jgi:hypothetical protein
VGCHAFSPAQVAAALESDLDVQIASIPGASTAAYVLIVRQAVISGYLNAGYLTATATAERDPASGTIVVTVAEGPRFTCGPIRVVGATTLPVDQLVAKLTAGFPSTLFPLDFTPKDGTFRVRALPQAKDAELPAWGVGEPVRGDPRCVQTLRDALRRCACELGYFDLWAETRFTTDTPISTLEITVRAEGPRAVLDAVDVDGARRNSPQRVTQLAGLEVGKPLDLVRLREVQQRLWDAARFTEHTVYAEPRRGDPSRVRVRIELREYEHAPKLDEPFSPVEQAALKFRQWAAGVRDREEDVVATMRWPGGRVEAALGHRRGFVARVYGPGPEGGPLGGLFATDGGVGLVAVAGGRVYRAGIPPVNLHMDLMVGPAPDPQDGREMSTGLYVGANSRPDPGAPPLELRPAFAPVAFVQLVHGRDNSFEVRDGVLEGRGGWIKRLSVDAATGRLLQLEGVSEDGQYIGTLSVKSGAVDGMVASMTDRTTNASDPATPVASFVRFAVAQGIQLRGLAGGAADPGRDRSAAEAAGKLLTNDALAPLEPVGASLLATFEADAFRVPHPPLADQRAPGAYLLAPTLKSVDDLFPRASWPWTLARLAVVVQAGEYRGATEEVGRLMASDDVGAIGYLVAAELLAQAGPAMAPPFAKRGLDRLDAERFDKDLDQILADGFPPAQVLGRLAANLRGLAPAEVEALAAVLPAEAGARLVRLAEALRRQSDAPPHQLLRAALRDAWSAGLRETVDARLRQLASPESAAP